MEPKPKPEAPEQLWIKVDGEVEARRSPGLGLHAPNQIDLVLIFISRGEQDTSTRTTINTFSRTGQNKYITTIQLASEGLPKRNYSCQRGSPD